VSFFSFIICLVFSKTARTGSSKSKKAKLTNKKSGLAPAKSKVAPAAEDESMVAAGGPAVDDDTQEHIERPLKGKKKKGKPVVVSA
jgi:hypothetical protein